MVLFPGGEGRGGGVGGEGLLNIKCVFCAITLSETIPIFRRTGGDITINLHGFSCGVSCQVLMALLIFWTYSRKIVTIPNSTKILPVGAELFHADGGAERETEMTKLIIAFRNFANAPKKFSSYATEDELRLNYLFQLISSA